MKLIAIVAATPKMVIGRDGTMPWRLRSDLLRFKKLTMGHPIIMGRKTFESLGRLLPGRANLVMTRQPDWSADGVEIFHSVQETLVRLAKDEQAFVIGGAEIYRLFMPMCEKIYLTRVHCDLEGDTKIDTIDFRLYSLECREEHPAGGEDQYPTTFEIWKRTTCAPTHSK